MLSMALEYRKGVFIVRLDGSLTRNNVHYINNYLLLLLKKHHIQKLICNLSLLSKIDETGLEALARTKDTMNENQGVMYLCTIPNHLKKKCQYLKVKQVENEEMAFQLLNV